MSDGLDDVRLVLPGVRLDAAERLRGGERSEVRRVRARWPDGGDTSVVVKRFVTAGEGWAREAAAFATIAFDGAPRRVVAEGTSPPLLVLTDLGAGPNVADALLGNDPAAAGAAVLAWSEAMASLHRATLSSRDRFRAELALRAGDLPIADHAMSTVVDEASGLLDTQCGRLGVTVPRGALRELRQIPRELRHDGPAALSPSDACPDDNVRLGDTVSLVDFEGAQWRHVAWDVSYLIVPWPTCWCSWRMPADVAERAVERYRATIEDELPYVRTADFRRDVALAALAWEFVSTAVLLPDALDADPPAADSSKVMPTRRAMILHRLGAARRNTHRPALAALAAQLRADLVQRWGEMPLGYAPAFEERV
jgi:hypothetical protein